MTKYETHVFQGDSRVILEQIPTGSINLIITSPPYADARKTHYDSIHVDKYCEFFMSFHNEFWRVLAEDGSFVLNIKDKVIDGVRHRYVWETIIALSKEGWQCVDDYLWIKPNAMPGFWKNRLRDEWEYCFHLTKNKQFRMFQHAVSQPIGKWAPKRLSKLTGKSSARHNSENASGFGRDLTAWKDKERVLPGNTVSVPLVGKNMGHPAVFPIGLPEFFIKLFTQEGDSILDPFGGSGSVALAAELLNRNVTLIEKKREYIDVIEQRLNRTKTSERIRVFHSVEGDKISTVSLDQQQFDFMNSDSQ